MKVLGVYYTNNRIKKELLDRSIEQSQIAISNLDITSGQGSKLVISSWESIKTRENQVSFYKNNGHLNIVVQILRILYTNRDFDYVTFMEHDCLYHPEYLQKVVQKITSNNIDGISNFNYVGLNETGYQKVIQHDQPLSQLTLRYDFAVDVMQNKLDQCIINGQCIIEPDRNTLVHLDYDLREPQNIHVNMNHQTENHHLTNHYDCYEEKSTLSSYLPYWGSASNFTFFK